MMSVKSQLKPSLRERKKEKTLASVQETALRLFLKQGYENTTIEQIAEAAEISPSTFFRYFPTKGAVVLHDSLDPILIDALHSQPAKLNVVQALRRTLTTVFAEMPKERLARELQRGELIRTVPELRAAMLDEFARNIDMLSELIAERKGLAADDIAVRTLAGAIIGVIMSALLKDTNPKAEYFSHFDEALEQFEKGLSL